MQVIFPGTLYVTDKHACFAAPGSGGQVKFTIAYKDISEAVKVVDRSRKTGERAGMHPHPTPPIFHHQLVAAVTVLPPLCSTDRLGAHWCASTRCMAQPQIQASLEGKLVVPGVAGAGAAESLRILFGGDQHAAFQGFKAADDLNSALALLEHLTAVDA